MMVGQFFNKKRMFMALCVVIILGIVLIAIPVFVGSGASGYPLAAGETVASWKLSGAGTNVAVTNKEIARLKGLIGKAGVPDYDLYVGIASEYELLGDGKTAYQYFSKAIAVDPSRGLAYYNLGHLLEGLGALKTARSAYEAAAKAEPTVSVYQEAVTQFDTRHQP